MSADETTATPLDLDAIEAVARSIMETDPKWSRLDEGPTWHCDEQSDHVAMAPAMALALVAEVRRLREEVRDLQLQLAEDDDDWGDGYPQVWCADRDEHEPHWHTVRAGGITYGGGWCRGEARGEVSS